MSGYTGSSPGVDSLLDQLRQQGRPVNLENSKHIHYNEQNSYYGHIQSQQRSPREYLTATTPTTSLERSANHNSVSQSTADVTQFKVNSGDLNSGRTSNLLNLLKFSQSTPIANNTQTPAPIDQLQPQSREASSSYAESDQRNKTGNTFKQEDPNLLTLITSPKAKANEHMNPHLPTTSTTKSNFIPVSTSPSADTQAYLLQLLHQPKAKSKSEENEESSSKQEFQATTPQFKLATHHDTVNLLPQSKAEKPMEMNTTGGLDKIPTPKSNKGSLKGLATTKSVPGMFTYVNPFDGLAASSPRNRIPKLEKPVSSHGSTFQILKNPRYETSESKQNIRVDNSSTGQRDQKPESACDKNTESSSLSLEAIIQGKVVVNDHTSQNKNVEKGFPQKGLDKLTLPVNVTTSCPKEQDHKLQIENKLRQMIVLKSKNDIENSANLNIEVEALKQGRETDTSDRDPPKDGQGEINTMNRSTLNHVFDNWETADTEQNSVQNGEKGTIKVYTFPLQPWTSIIFEPSKEKLPEFRDDSIVDIARLKREFDQVDRTLVTASNNFIVYGMSKNGGFRIIRQEDGKDARMFMDTHDRIFNVNISTSLTEKKEAVIGTGISGTVYWTQLKSGEGDRIEDSHLESYGFILPPLPGQDTESLNAISKTRARRSSSHPEFFAVGRGKFVYLIFPSSILDNHISKETNSRQVNVDSYLNHHIIKINTGKAGKDFAFSEDDTTIASLDKTGRIKFWDIRGLTKHVTHKVSSDLQPTELKTPIVTFICPPVTEKSRPTSILFVDKTRPYNRGGALRYLIVGMMQNHVLQLWDLALAKPVQEIRLPHGNDSDPMCIVVYHASTGMIIVGHPTRNSIYFIHLSVPKYNLSKSISQAEYLEKIAIGDTSIQRPDATAVISDMREYSFAPKGVLRSLDILQTPSSAGPCEVGSLFELYCMHSKGVTYLNIKLEDLGWDSENKVVHAVDAEDLKLITVKPLQLDSTTLKSESVEVKAQIVTPTRIAQRSTIKDTEASKENMAKKTMEVSMKSSLKSEDKSQKLPAKNISEESIKSSHLKLEEKNDKLLAKTKSEQLTKPLQKIDDEPSKFTPEKLLEGSAKSNLPKIEERDGKIVADTVPESSNRTNALKVEELNDKKDKSSSNGNLSAPVGSEKMEKKKRRKTPNDTAGSSQNNGQFKMPLIDPLSNVRHINSIRLSQNSQFEPSTQSSVNELGYKSVEKLFNTSFDKLSQDFRLEKVTQNAIASANQQAVLKMVSTTLNDNIEATLSKIIKSSIELEVLPVISDITLRAVHDQISTQLDKKLAAQLTQEFQNSFPDIISKTLHQPQISKIFSDTLNTALGVNIQKELNKFMTSNLMPLISNLLAQSTQNIAAETKSRLMVQMNLFEQQRQSDSNKIVQLTQLVTGLSETVSSMAAAQTEFQAQFLKMQSMAAHGKYNVSHFNEGHVNHQATRPPTALADLAEKTRNDEEYERMMKSISVAMNAGEYENAVVQWLQTGREQEIFANYFSNFSPELVRKLSPLLLLSLGSSITLSFETEVKDSITKRIAWLEAILATYQAHITAGTTEDETRDISPKIMDIFRQRFEHLYMRISQISPHDPILKRITLLISTTNHIIETTRVDERVHEYARELGGGTTMPIGRHSL